MDKQGFSLSEAMLSLFVIATVAVAGAAAFRSSPGDAAWAEKRLYANAGSVDMCELNLKDQLAPAVHQSVKLADWKWSSPSSATGSSPEPIQFSQVRLESESETPSGTESLQVEAWLRAEAGNPKGSVQKYNYPVSLLVDVATRKIVRCLSPKATVLSNADCEGEGSWLQGLLGGITVCQNTPVSLKEAQMCPAGQAITQVTQDGKVVCTSYGWNDASVVAKIEYEQFIKWDVITGAVASSQLGFFGDPLSPDYPNPTAAGANKSDVYDRLQLFIDFNQKPELKAANWLVGRFFVVDPGSQSVSLRLNVDYYTFDNLVQWFPDYGFGPPNHDPTKRSMPYYANPYKGPGQKKDSLVFAYQLNARDQYLELRSEVHFVKDITPDQFPNIQANLRLCTGLSQDEQNPCSLEYWRQIDQGGPPTSPPGNGMPPGWIPKSGVLGANF
ncbi:MAG: hypothetical protein AB7P04_15030 [Bacteriovoracia bacterium]